MKFILTTILLLVKLVVLGQLNSFDLNITNVNHETCAGNGAVSWAVANTTTDATLSYKVYALKDTETLLTTTTETNFGGLTQGSYKLVATQTLDTESNQQEVTFSIDNQIKDLTFQISNVKSEYCTADAAITINAVGTGPFTYQILDENNDVVRTETTSTIDKMTSGIHRVRVVDNCGLAKVQDVEIQNISIFRQFYARYSNFDICTGAIDYTVEHQYREAKGKTFDLKITYTNPDTNALIEQQHQVDTGSIHYKSGKIPLEQIFPGKTITYDIELVNECGTVFNKTITGYNKDVKMEIRSIADNHDACGAPIGFSLKLEPVPGFDYFNKNYVTLTTVPNGVDLSTVDISDGRRYPVIGSDSQPLAGGLYEGTVESCGDIIPFSYNYEPVASSPTALTITQQTLNRRLVTVCDNSYSSIDFETNNPVQSFEMVNLPAGAEQLAQIEDQTYRTGSRIRFQLFNVPAGDYEVKAVDTCGAESTQTFSISYPEIKQGEVKFIPVCGGFSIERIAQTENTIDPPKYYLQFFDEGLNDWISPTLNTYKRPLKPTENTSDDYGRAGLELGYSTSGLGTYTLENENIERKGTFRVIEVYRYRIKDENRFFGYGSKYCHRVVEEYTTINDLSFGDIYLFECNDGSYSIYTSASGGIGNYKFQLVNNPNLDTNDNIKTDNGEDNIFRNLELGINYLRVIDACGNYVTKEFDVADLETPEISLDFDCSLISSQDLELTVNAVNYLDFKWYKEGDEATTLSTTNKLNLGVYDESKKGIYYLHLYSSLVTGCVDRVLEFELKDLTNSCKIIVPVELSDFTAKQEENDVTLNWVTLSENNNSHFDILRSIDGLNFSKIAEVKGANNSQNTKYYNYLDKNAAYLNSKVYYKLLQVDFDGTTEESDIKLVELKFTNQFVITPNPAKDFINISYPEKINKVLLFNSNGKLVLEHKDLTSKSIDIHQLPTGTYLLKVRGETISKTLKFIKE